MLCKGCLSPVSQWIHISSVAHSSAVSDVIVNYLMLLWQLLITPLVLWRLAIQHRNNTASSTCQSLSVGDTFPGVWLSIRTGLVTVFTCGPSTFLRLIPYKPDWPFSLPLFSPSLQFSSIRAARNRLLALYWQCNNMIQTKTPSLSTFSFFSKSGINILCSRSCSHKGKNM